MTSTGAAASAMAASVVTSHLQNHVVQSFETLQHETKLQQRRQRQVTWAVACTSVASVLAAMLAMYATGLTDSGGVVCYIAMLFPLVLGPYTILQRRRLNRLPTLCQEINLCRTLVNRMSIQNDRLQQQTNKLTAQVARLAQLQAQLAGIAAKNNMTQEELQALCHDNAVTLRQMKQLQQAAELQRLLSTILQSDSNQDRRISEQELDRLSQRLQVFSNSQRPIDDGLLRQAFRMSGTDAISTTTLFSLTKNMMEENEAMDREIAYLDYMTGETTTDAHGNVMTASQLAASFFSSCHPDLSHNSQTSSSAYHGHNTNSSNGGANTLDCYSRCVD